MWKTLGFRENPYDVKPLSVKSDDVELLVGRETETVEFGTAIESANSGIYIISGAPGVGKTSFFNIQQYTLETVGRLDGTRILSARLLCPIQVDDTGRTIAERIISNFIRSAKAYAESTGKKLPDAIKKIDKWVNNAKDVGIDFGIQIAGFGGNIGRSVQLPRIGECTFEHLQDALEGAVNAACIEWNFSAVFISLDNVENLGDKQLTDLLMSLRDTLFCLDKIWWVLIGQSGLGTLIQTIDSRVSDRITGSGLQLKPITLAEMLEAINLRIEKFHGKKKKTSLLHEETYQHLYRASNGELRFTFKYCSSICIKLVTKFKIEIAKKKTPLNDEVLSKALGDVMLDDIIPAPVCEELLAEIVKDEICGLELRPKDKKIILYLNENTSVRPSEFEKLGFKSMQDFSANYLRPLFEKDLLVRDQIGKEVRYRLRGLAYLASEYELVKI
jgi:Cdc6-like AAA superfamily ATPase